MGYDDAMFNLAMFYDRQKDYDKEKFYLEKLAAKNQNDAIFHFNWQLFTGKKEIIRRLMNFISDC